MERRVGTMSAFVLVDLSSQASAVARYIQGWSNDKIIRWLQQFGEVQQAAPPFSQMSDMFGFRSFVGLTTGFRLTTDGKLIILGDHTMYTPTT